MYEASFGLGHAPFRLLPDPRFYLDDGQYGKVLARLIEGLEAGEPCLLLTGPPGTGKTAAVQRLLMLLDRKRWSVGAMFASADAKGADVMNAVVYAFNLARSDTQPGPAFDAWLKHQSARRARVLLVVDEAENLDEGALRQLAERLARHRGAPGLQLCLVGQQAPAAIADAVRDGALPPVTVHCQLRPLDAAETRDYVLHRLRRAGWKGRPAFDQAATDAIHRRSEGIPRRIHLIAERVLLQLSLDDADVATVAAVESADDSRTVELRGRAPVDPRPADASSPWRGTPNIRPSPPRREAAAQRAEPPALPPLPAAPVAPVAPAAPIAPPVAPVAAAATAPRAPPASPPHVEPDLLPVDPPFDATERGLPPPEPDQAAAARGPSPREVAAPGRSVATHSRKAAISAALLVLAAIGVAWWLGFGGALAPPAAPVNPGLAEAPAAVEPSARRATGEVATPATDPAPPSARAAAPTAEPAPPTQRQPQPQATAPAPATPPPPPAAPAMTPNGAGRPPPSPSATTTTTTTTTTAPPGPPTTACTPTAAVLGLCEPAAAPVPPAAPPARPAAPAADVAPPPPAVPPAAPCEPSRAALGLCDR